MGPNSGRGRMAPAVFAPIMPQPLIRHDPRGVKWIMVLESLLAPERDRCENAPQGVNAGATKAVLETPCLKGFSQALVN